VDVAAGRREDEPVQLGFEVPYDAGEGHLAKISVRVGYGHTLPWADYQVVTIDDPRLQFMVEGEVSSGRVAHIRLQARPEETIQQRDLRAAPFVSMVQDWAAAGREYQLAIERLFEDANGRPPNESEEPGRQAVLDMHERLGALWGGDSHAAAVQRTRELVSAAARERPADARARGAEADMLLERVVKEYRDAVDRGERAPVASVATRLGYHRTHISRLLRKAREDGADLPPAKPRGPQTGQSNERREN